MKLFITFSGGMGVSYRGSVDLSTLPNKLKDRVSEKFSEKNLSRASMVNRDNYVTDSIDYEIQYEETGKTFSIDESRASSDILELIDDLQPYLVLEAK